jgi:hypothetical protein
MACESLKQNAFRLETPRTNDSPLLLLAGDRGDDVVSSIRSSVICSTALWSLLREFIGDGV